jgi:serine protease Do
MRGEIIGINAAVSRQANNIGFAIPINQARAILPQLKAEGRVSRGYIGVALRDVDPDLQVSLGLDRSEGALVQDVTAGSPGARAGIKPYDLIVAVDREAVRSNDALIREIAHRTPGSAARIELLRDGRPMELSLKLAERPGRVTPSAAPTLPARRGTLDADDTVELGLTLIEIDETNAHRFDVPGGMTGLLVQRVEPFSAAYDAGITRGQILLEVNRRPVNSVAAYRRLVQAQAGGVLAVFLYDPEIAQRTIHTVRTETR